MRYFEDYAIGARHRTAARTLTETHVIQFCMLTGDWYPLHADKEWAEKEGPFGKRIAHGTYTLSDLPDGGTHIEFEFALQKVPAMERPLVPLMRKMVRKGNERAMERLAALLADGQAQAKAA